jgi:hypothetical protein
MVLLGKVAAACASAAEPWPAVAMASIAATTVLCSIEFLLESRSRVDTCAGLLLPMLESSRLIFEVRRGRLRHFAAFTLAPTSK